MSDDAELNLPKPYGTKNCTDCGAVPGPEDSWWHHFDVIDGVMYSLPHCDACDGLPKSSKYVVQKYPDTNWHRSNRSVGLNG